MISILDKGTETSHNSVSGISTKTVSLLSTSRTIPSMPAVMFCSTKSWVKLVQSRGLILKGLEKSSLHFSWFILFWAYSFPAFIYPSWHSSELSFPEKGNREFAHYSETPHVFAEKSWCSKFQAVLELIFEALAWESESWIFFWIYISDLKLMFKKTLSCSCLRYKCAQGILVYFACAWWKS